MPLAYIDQGPRGDKVKLVECPVCGADLSSGQPSWHIAQHDPEDFGLEPLRTAPDQVPAPTAGGRS